LVQTRTSGDLQGRAFSAFDLIASLPQTISIALGAALISVLGYQGELTIIAAVVALAALVLLLPVPGEPNFGPLETHDGIQGATSTSSEETGEFPSITPLIER
jgi:hypothetical protein